MLNSDSTGTFFSGPTLSVSIPVCLLFFRNIVCQYAKTMWLSWFESLANVEVRAASLLWFEDIQVRCSGASGGTGWRCYEVF